ncbi:MAG: 30S ribosome-binding factor RbfA [Alphaproteobacteria bacterium]|nr:30S ribosome-binding factor RbfA [Alphaproteobacteria bacterium]
MAGDFQDGRARGSGRRRAASVDGRPRSQRQLRVGEELRHALSEIFLREGFRDPDLESVNLTVTEVRSSPDLRNATVFVSPLGGGEAARILAGLKRAAPYLRSEVARRVHLKYLPRFDFKLDESFDEAARIDAALEDKRVKRDLIQSEDSDEPV